MKKRFLVLSIIMVVLIAGLTISFAGISCPECGDGILTISTNSYQDYCYQPTTHDHCNKDYEHTYYWTVEEKKASCDSCNFSSERTNEYGYYCK